MTKEEHVATDSGEKPTREDVKQAIDSWIEAQGSELPPIVRHALMSYVELIDKLDAKSKAMNKLLKELRVSFGIVPSSEKRKKKNKNYGTTTKLSERQRLLSEKTRHDDLARKHEAWGRKARRKSSDIALRIKQLEEIELSPEEEALIEENSRILSEATDVRAGEVDPECVLPQEDLFQGLVKEHQYDELDCPLDEKTKSKAKKVFTEERRRLDLEVRVVTQVIEVEKAQIRGPDGPRVVSASTDHIGPPGMMVTWNFLSQLSILVAQYGMPLTRFSSLVSTPEERFSSSKATRYFHYVARRLAPIYLQMFRDLASSAVLGGDDTTTRTLEVTKALEEGRSPWESYADRKSAETRLSEEEKPPLGALLGAVIPFVSVKKVGDAGAKRSFNTSLVHGRSDEKDPRSTIVVFRSHFGSFGNLVEHLLEYRNPSLQDLVVVSDLASTNTVRHNHFRITQAGCTSHARRRFKKNEDELPHYAELMLHQFAGLYTHEKLLDISGRNRDNTTAVRTRSSERIWHEMLADAKNHRARLSPSTGLGDATQYLIRNFDALTYYPKDPRVSLTNDLSERLLRTEKQIQGAALFRKTLEGRFSLDVIRSLIQTSVAAGANSQEYLSWVLAQDEASIAADPQSFTPRSFVKATADELSEGFSEAVMSGFTCH